MKKIKLVLINSTLDMHILFVYFILFLYLFLFNGCDQSNKLEIKDDKGEIVEIITLLNDKSNRLEYISYHSNGTVKEEGYIEHGERTGIWKQYYNDGTQRWLGKYKNGIRQLPELDSTVVDKTKIIRKGVTPDGYSAFRLSLPDSLSPSDLMYSVSNAYIRITHEFDSSDFEIRPINDKEAIILKIYALNGYEGPIFGIKLDLERLNVK